MADSASSPPAPPKSLLKRTQWLQRALTPWTRPVAQRLAATSPVMPTRMPLAARDALAISGRVQRLGGGEAPTPSLGPAAALALPLQARAPAPVAPITPTAPAAIQETPAEAPTPAPAPKGPRDIFSFDLSKLPPLKKESSYDRPKIARSPLPTTDGGTIQTRRPRRFSQIEEITPAAPAAEKPPTPSTPTFESDTSAFEGEGPSISPIASSPSFTASSAPDFSPRAEVHTAAPTSVALKREPETEDAEPEPDFLWDEAANSAAAQSTSDAFASIFAGPTASASTSPASPAIQRALDPTSTPPSSAPVSEAVLPVPVGDKPTPAFTEDAGAFASNQKLSPSNITPSTAENKPLPAAPATIQREAEPAARPQSVPPTLGPNNEISEVVSSAPAAPITAKTITSPAAGATTPAQTPTSIQRAPAAPPTPSRPTPAPQLRETPAPTPQPTETIAPTLPRSETPIQRQAVVPPAPATPVSESRVTPPTSERVQRTPENTGDFSSQTQIPAAPEAEPLAFDSPAQPQSAPSAPSASAKAMPLVQRAVEPALPNAASSATSTSEAAPVAPALPTAPTAKTESPTPAAPRVQRTPEAASAAAPVRPQTPAAAVSTANSTEVPSNALTGDSGPKVSTSSASPNIQRSEIAATPAPVSHSVDMPTASNLSAAVDTRPDVAPSATEAIQPTFAESGPAPLVQRAVVPAVVDTKPSAPAPAAETPPATRTDISQSPAPLPASQSSPSQPVVQRSAMPLVSPTPIPTEGTSAEASPTTTFNPTAEISPVAPIQAAPAKPAVQRAIEIKSEGQAAPARPAAPPADQPAATTPVSLVVQRTPETTHPAPSPTLVQRQPVDEAQPVTPSAPAETPSAISAPAAVQRAPANAEALSATVVPSAPAVPATPTRHTTVQRATAEAASAPASVPPTSATSSAPSPTNVEQTEGDAASDWPLAAETGVLDTSTTPLAIQRTPLPLVAPEAPATALAASAPESQIETRSETPQAPAVEAAAKPSGVQRKATPLAASVPNSQPEAPKSAVEVSAPATPSAVQRKATPQAASAPSRLPETPKAAVEAPTPAQPSAVQRKATPQTTATEAASDSPAAAAFTSAGAPLSVQRTPETPSESAQPPIASVATATPNLQRQVDEAQPLETIGGEVTSGTPSNVAATPAQTVSPVSNIISRKSALPAQATPAPVSQPGSTVQRQRAPAESPALTEATPSGEEISASVQSAPALDLPLVHSTPTAAPQPTASVQRTALPSAPVAAPSTTPTVSQPQPTQIPARGSSETPAVIQAKPQPNISSAPTTPAVGSFIAPTAEASTAPEFVPTTAPVPAVQRASLASETPAVPPAMPLVQATSQQPSAAVQRAPQVDATETPQPATATAVAEPTHPTTPTPPSSGPAQVQRTPAQNVGSPTPAQSISAAPESGSLVSAVGPTARPNAPVAEAPLPTSPTLPSIQRQPLPLVSNVAATPSVSAPSLSTPAEGISIKPLSEIVQARASASRLAQSFPPLVQRWVNRSTFTPETAAAPTTITRPEIQQDLVVPVAPLPGVSRGLPLAVSTGTSVQRTPATTGPTSTTARTSASPSASPAEVATPALPPVSAPPPEPVLAPAATATALVQRDFTGTTGGPSAVSQSNSPAVPTPTVTSPTPAELDLDKLAQEVYPYIRRLLAIERERRSLY